MAMVKLRESHDEGELALIQSLLDANNIAYFIQNEHFGSLYPGSVLPFNTRILMVRESDIAKAETLLRELDRPKLVDLE
jgi:Putative prokaryotic signal transducing protein